MRDWPLPSARCSVPRRLHHGQNAASGRQQSPWARPPLVAPQTFSEEALGISQPRGHLGRLTNHEHGEPRAAYGARAERALAAACSLCFVRFLLPSARLQTAQFTARRDSADGARSSHCRWPPACPPRCRPSERPAERAARRRCSCAWLGTGAGAFLRANAQQAPAWSCHAIATALCCHAAPRLRRDMTLESHRRTRCPRSGCCAPTVGGPLTPW